MSKERLTHTLLKTTFYLLGFQVLLTLSFSVETKRQALSERGAHCQRCGRTPGKGKLFAHHILPQSWGGADILDNLYLSCGACHVILDSQIFSEGILADGRDASNVEMHWPELIDIDKHGVYCRAIKKLTKKRLRNHA